MNNFSKDTQNEEKITASDYHPGLLKHIVLFRYREGITDQQRQEVEDRFHALAKSHRNGAPYILGIESGAQNSPEGLHAGLEHGFIVTFKSEGDRNYYLGRPFINNASLYDPAHDEFKEFVGKYLHPRQGSIMVFDFTMNEGAASKS
jgi:hypothetical protein